MKTPTDKELLDYLDKLPSKSTWYWQLTVSYGCIFLDKNTSFGTKTVREAIIQHMEKNKETDLTK